MLVIPYVKHSAHVVLNIIIDRAIIHLKSNRYIYTHVQKDLDTLFFGQEKSNFGNFIIKRYFYETLDILLQHFQKSLKNYKNWIFSEPFNK